MSVADATLPPFKIILVPVAPSLQDWIDAALTRLGYLYPTLSFERSVEGVVVVAPVEDEAKVRQDVLHTIYRERILDRTITMRRTLIDGLMAS